MHKKFVSRFVAAAIGAAAILCIENEFAKQHDVVDRKFSQPDRIRFDRHSLVLDGKPVFIILGELNCFSVPSKMPAFVHAN
jgi:hypothetical protein